MPPLSSNAITRQLSGLSQMLTRSGKAVPMQPGSTEANSYFGPGVEVAPIFNDPRTARGWQYWINQNMVFTPRPDAQYTAQALRNLATYPLHRIAIENAKDIIANLPRQVRAKKKPGETNSDVDKRSKGDPTLRMLNQLFDCPDGEHDWGEWIRRWLEEVYTIDAACVLVRRNRGGQIIQLRSDVDGAFITCLVDEWGFRPQPPDPAYQQLWSGTPSTVGGIPFVDLTTQDLVYRPRNIVPRNTVTSFLYGYSPTEQNAEEIKVGQERLNFVLSWYTSGQMPDLIHVVPPNVNPDQLKATQKGIEAELSGQTFKRSGTIRMLQGFVDRAQAGASTGDQFVNPKEKLFADPFDEMHIRKIFYAVGVSPQRILKAMNRASAQAGQEAAEEEGTMPIALSAAAMVNWVIAKVFGFGFGSYELTYDQPQELDAVKRSTAAKNDVDSGIISRDEERIARGMDPVGGDAAKLMITTNTGTVPVEMSEQVKQAKAMADAQPKPQPAGKGGDVQKGRKAHIDPAHHTADTRQAQARMEGAIARVFMRQKEKAALKAGQMFKLRKADDPEKKADEIYADIRNEFAALVPEARAALEQAYKSGGSEAVLQVEISDAKMLSSVNRIAEDFAAKRAAEMVGMKYNDEGELVPNPDARFAISDTTRDRLREIVKNAFGEKTPFSELIDDIRNADIFSEKRAALIARTEVSQAQVGANFKVWQESGLVNKVKWLAVSGEPCPTCEMNANVVRELGKEFPSGDKHPTAHPGCYCILQAVEFVR